MKKSKSKAFMETWLPPIIVLIVIVVGLEVIGRATNASPTGIFPVPSFIWEKMKEVFALSFNDYTFTIGHMFLGFFVSIPIAFVIAALLAQSKVVIKATSTLVLIVATMPMIVLMPLLFIWTKYASYTRPLACILTVTPIILLNVLSGFTEVSADKEALAAVYGMNRWQRFFKVVVPQAVPRIFVGLRLGAINSALGAISVELVGGGGDQGLGYRVSTACMYNDVQKAYACIILLAVTAYILSSVITSVEKKVTAHY